MKILGLILGYISGGARQRNTRLVLQLVAVVALMVAVYSAIFHELMAREGRQYSWITAVYWTLTTMSTLGFGDITFHSDMGRAFSVVVLLTGTVFVLVLLPFVFIEFLFLPWIRARDAGRTPRQLPASTRDHLVIVGQGPVTDALVNRAVHSALPYVIIEPDRDEALRLHDADLKAMVGDVDNPNTYRNARVDQASLVAALMGDATNANVAFTVREISCDVPIAALSSNESASEVLRLAGCTTVLELSTILGTAIAARVLGHNGRFEEIARFGDLLVTEALVVHPDLLSAQDIVRFIRQQTDVYAVGIWSHGRYVPLELGSTVKEGDALILAGSAEQLSRWDSTFGQGAANRSDSHVLVLGGGKVGRAAIEYLVDEGFSYTVIEQQPGRVPDDSHCVVGDARDLDVLAAAGIDKTHAVIVTTHDDDLNVYLTITCRRLRDDVQILARANRERNVATLERAGADAVLSYAALGAGALRNAIGLDDTVVIAEGIELVRLSIPQSLAGRTLADAAVVEHTGCRVVALIDRESFVCNPARDMLLPQACDLVLIADAESLYRFHKRFESLSQWRMRRRGRRSAPSQGLRA